MTVVWRMEGAEAETSGGYHHVSGICGVFYIFIGVKDRGTDIRVIV